MNKNKYVIIVAGGKGSRMGTDIPKQFLLLQGKPVLMHTIKAFHCYNPSIHIILVLSNDQQIYWQELCNCYDFHITHQVAVGGETRFHSVQNGLAMVNEKSLVAIHDGVRPLVSQELITRLFDIAAKTKAVYPAVQVTDTLRQLLPDNNTKGVNRSQFYLVQTPQVFYSYLLIHAYQVKYSKQFTDDISVVEKQKLCRPAMTEGSCENIKITTPVDLIIAEAILQQRNE